ncbi:MAG: hypothetical protein ACKVT0_21180 [Planctomycetaceae bacterium]
MIGLLLLVGPCAIGVWIGTRVRWPAIAFFLAWLITPAISYVAVKAMIPVLRAVTPPDNDGTWVIMVPFFGIVTGLGGGIAAAMIVFRRHKSGTIDASPLD